MKYVQTQAEMAALELRYGADFSQYLVDQIGRLDERAIEFLDVKELNDLVGEYRTRIRDLIALYRTTKNETGANDNRPLMRRVYANHETVLLHRQIADLRKLYRMAWADSRELTEEYIRRLNVRAYPVSNK